MRYIGIGFMFGVIWAIMQWVRGEITEPVALIVPVLFCGLFGVFLWGMRLLVIKLRK